MTALHLHIEQAEDGAVRLTIELPPKKATEPATPPPDPTDVQRDEPIAQELRAS